MTVYLERALNRYIGLSTDTKPLALADGTGMPVGSSFLEADTSRLFRWTGAVWTSISSGAVSGGADLGGAVGDVNGTLLQVLRELRGIRQLLEFQTEMSITDLEAGDLAPA